MGVLRGDVRLQELSEYQTKMYPEFLSRDSLPHLEGDILTGNLLVSTGPGSSSLASTTSSPTATATSRPSTPTTSPAFRRLTASLPASSSR